MLGKLLKHDFIATGRIMGTVYAVAGLIMAYVLGSYYFVREKASAGQIVGVGVLILISACSFILTAVVMVVNFQRTLYGDQGYLTFTLPVKGVSILSSKVITSTIWFIIAFACLMGTSALSVYVIKDDLLGEEGVETIESILPMFLEGKSISTIATTIVISMISFFVRFAVITLELYFAISIANTRIFQKRHTLWTIVFIIAIVMVVQKISYLISDKITFGLSILQNKIAVVTSVTQMATASSFIDLVSLISYIIFGVGFFFATFYVMNKKVNIS